MKYVFLVVIVLMAITQLVWAQKEPVNYDWTSPLLEVRPAENPPLTHAEATLPAPIPIGINVYMRVACTSHTNDPPDAENENLDCFVWTHPDECNLILHESEIRTQTSVRTQTWTGKSFGTNHTTFINWNGNVGSPSTIYILRGTLSSHIWNPNPIHQDGPQGP
jgi:hypothetical protein